MPGFTGYSAAGSYYPGAGTGQSASSALPPHLSTSHPGSGGGGSTGSAAAAQEAKYYLTNAIPPPSISEPGINALDDVLKTSRKSHQKIVHSNATCKTGTSFKSEDIYSGGLPV